MKDFDEQDWKEVCENIQKAKKEFLATMSPEELRPYHLERREHINELGMSKKDYERVVDRHCGEIHEHVYKICCLGDMFSDSVKHWRNEIKAHIKKLFYVVLKDNLKKDKILMNNFIKPMLDTKTFEPDGDGVYISAMKDELNNARRNPDDICLRKGADFIRRDILPHITQIRMRTKKSVGILMKAIYTGLIDEDMGIIERALDAFIREWVPDAEDKMDLCDR